MSDLLQLHEAIAAAMKTLQSLVDLEAQVGSAADLIEDVCVRETNCWYAGMAEVRLMLRILRRNL